MNINNINESIRNGRIDQGEKISLQDKQGEIASGKVYYYRDKESKQYTILIKTDKGIFQIKTNTLKLEDLKGKEATNTSTNKFANWTVEHTYQTLWINEETKQRGLDPAKCGYTRGIFFTEQSGAVAFDKAIKNNNPDKIDFNITNGKLFVKIDGKNYELDKKSFPKFKEVLLQALIAKHKGTYYFGKDDLAIEINRSCQILFAISAS